jgi:PAS domain S-box-containing protein
MMESTEPQVPEPPGNRQALAPGQYEALYHGVLSISPDAILVTDLDAMVLTGNMQAAALLGYAGIQELTGRRMFEFIALEDRGTAERYLRDTVATTIISSIECSVLGKDGTLIPVQLTASVVADEAAEPSGFVAIVRDMIASKRADLEIASLNNQLEDRILEQHGAQLEAANRDLQLAVATNGKLAQELRRRAEGVQADYERMAAIVNAADISLAFRDMEMRFILLNDTWLRRTGYDRERVIGHRAEEFGNPDQRPVFVDMVARIFATGAPVTIRDLFTTTDAHPEGYYVDVTLQPVSDAAGDVTGLLSVGIDVTEKVLARQQVESQKALLQTIFDTAPAGIAYYDRDMRLIDYNSEYKDMLDPRVPFLLGEVLYDIYPATLARKPIYDRVLAGDRVDAENVAYPYSDGEVRYRDARYRPVRDAGGAVVGMVTTVVDVTDKVRARQEIESQKALLQTIFDSAPIGIAYYDRDMRLIDYNSEYNDLTDLRFALARGEVIYDLVPPALARKPIYERVLAGEQVVDENFRRESPDGEVRYFDVRYEPVRDANGEVAGMVTTVVDVTGRHNIEEQKEELLALVAHELKTPITAIKGFAGAASRTARRLNDDKLERALAIISDQSDHLTRLIDDLNDVARTSAGPLKLYRERFDLYDLLKEVVGNLLLAAPDFAFPLDLPGAAAIVSADRQRIEQVLINLLNNAVKYSGGNRVVETSARLLKHQVIVTVRDYGVGIPPDQQRQVFQRFFRSRNVSSRQFSGLGLGLFISHSIITRHGGHIWLESAEREGSTFFFSLPLAEAGEPAAQ